MNCELKTVYLSLGSNLGDKRATIDEAIRLIDKQIGTVVRRSAFYVSEPWGFSSPNSFANAAVCCLTELSPQEVLHASQAIECSLGRTRKSIDGNYHDRTIDIDILLYDDIKMNTPELVIPHPLMHERDFVMTPLNEIMLKQC